jgi:transcriptional regulator of acetoin/glycerol metabolism
VLHGQAPVLRRSFLPEHILDRPASAAKAPTGSISPPSIVGAPTNPPVQNTPEYHRARRDRELSQLGEALLAHNGSVARAAAAVGISRQRAYRLMDAAGVVAASDCDDVSQDHRRGQ